MERKTIIILAACFGLFLLWPKLVDQIYPPKKLPPRTNTVATATNSIEAKANATPASLSATTNFPTPPPAKNPLTAPGTPEELLVVENAEARYTFTSHGGGVKLVELTKYPEAVGCFGANKSESNRLATLNVAAPLSVLAIVGGEAVQGDGVFKLARTAEGVRAEKLLTNGLFLVKDFRLGTNYLMAATVRLENRSAQPLTLPPQEWIAGTATPMSPEDDGLLLGTFWYDGKSAEHTDVAWFANRTLGCIPGTPRTQFLAGQNNVIWAAVHNQFFALAVMPATNSLPSQVVAVEVSLPAPSREQMAANPKTNPKPSGIQTGLVYPGLTLAPGQSVERQFQIYAGPKEYRTLTRLAAEFRNNMELLMDYSGFFGWFAQALLISMNGLHGLGLSYGLAIIAITIIIKLLFWPLTQASTRSMKRMSALQPQMKALQEKFKDDPTKMNRKLMEFMKEHKVSPLGGCLPMLLQIPVFFGFYRMIQSAIELRGAQFLWACDLSKPDTLFMIPGLNFPFNPLPLLMGATMLWQARLTPAAPGMDPMQQKIMKYMPLMFLFILYNFSAGLTLYWTVQNLLTIAQMKLTKAKDDPAGPAPAAPATTGGLKKKK